MMRRKQLLSRLVPVHTDRFCGARSHPFIGGTLGKCHPQSDCLVGLLGQRCSLSRRCMGTKVRGKRLVARRREGRSIYGPGDDSVVAIYCHWWCACGPVTFRGILLVIVVRGELHRILQALRKTGPQCVECFPHAATKQGIPPLVWLSTGWLHTPRGEQRAMPVIDSEIEERMIKGLTQVDCLQDVAAQALQRRR